MPIVTVQTCLDSTVIGTNNICPSASLVWQQVEIMDYAALTDVLLTVDPDIVGAIFGGSLLLFVTGIGAGWVANVIKMAR